MHIHKIINQNSTKFFSLCAVLFCAVSCSGSKELKVLQLNTWMYGTVVSGAPEGLTNVIDQTDPDVVFLCELDAGSADPLSRRVVEALGKRGKTYHSDGKNLHTGILSKYPLEKVSVLLPTKERHRPIVKAGIAVNGRTVMLYSAHLDHLHYAPYLPKGYGASTWAKIDAPVCDPDSILAANRMSLRDEAIRGFIRDAKAETDRGHPVIIGGDFNEPSHLDWQADTKDIRDHGGAAVNWDVSLMLQQAGYIDAYRYRNPNPLTHPGFTWPAGNEAAPLKKLIFTPDKDERERIDFIYYCPQQGVQLTDIHIVGPSASVDHGKITPSTSADKHIEPKGTWPSDHKGNLAVFQIASTADKVQPEKKDDLTFAFLTDVHLNVSNSGDRVNGLKQALERVKDTPAEWILFGGDLVDISGGVHTPKKQTDSMYTVFKQTVEQSGIPYFPAIGNHDRYFEPEKGYTKGDEVFKAQFATPSYYTFEKKGVRFFVLNAVQEGLCIDSEQMAWLKKELRKVSLATPIVVVQHVPVYSQYYPVVDGKFGPWDITCNYKEELAAFREHNLKLVLQGHQHLYEEIFAQNVQYITGGAVCANWWSGAFCGTEEGFLLVRMQQPDTLEWEYVDYGWTPPNN
ncbi:MAG: metallophosphoesterase [Bacteroidales bacterium]|jgi:3',5'-cyclic AMP phosphodiesterase CpdA/endonuclease/exonuclease/phosphatase family metal-dependent hydrolase|nr:metallophosphoesterase [Bacteroidales bacterium]